MPCPNAPPFAFQVEPPASAGGAALQCSGTAPPMKWALALGTSRRRNAPPLVCPELRGRRIIRIRLFFWILRIPYNNRDLELAPHLCYRYPGTMDKNLQTGRSTRATGKAQARILIADPRLEFALNRPQSSTYEFLIGGKQGLDLQRWRLAATTIPWASGGALHRSSVKRI
jgi:hypothetical protein